MVQHQVEYARVNTMPRSLGEIVASYDAQAPLARALTIPADWYRSSDILDLELRAAFGHSWQMAGRTDQVQHPGQYVSSVLASGEPIVVVRGRDGVLRAFFNVCRHHAAAVVTRPDGSTQNLR